MQVDVRGVAWHLRILSFSGPRYYFCGIFTASPIVFLSFVMVIVSKSEKYRDSITQLIAMVQWNSFGESETISLSLSLCYILSFYFPFICKEYYIKINSILKANFYLTFALYNVLIDTVLLELLPNYKLFDLRKQPRLRYTSHVFPLIHKSNVYNSVIRKKM